jgi:hypothetical protein
MLLRRRRIYPSVSGTGGGVFPSVSGGGGVYPWVSVLFWVPDGYDPDHFMPWVHPFSSVIAGHTGLGKSMFVRRFVHNIKHMIIEPCNGHCDLWFYGVFLDETDSERCT